VHGHVLLEIAGFFGHHGDSLERFLLPLVTSWPSASVPTSG
jgi:hypothetical protein